MVQFLRIVLRVIRVTYVRVSSNVCVSSRDPHTIKQKQGLSNAEAGLFPGTIGTSGY